MFSLCVLCVCVCVWHVVWQIFYDGLFTKSPMFRCTYFCGHVNNTTIVSDTNEYKWVGGVRGVSLVYHFRCLSNSSNNQRLILRSYTENAFLRYLYFGRVIPMAQDSYTWIAVRINQQSPLNVTYLRCAIDEYNE